MILRLIIDIMGLLCIAWALLKMKGFINLGGVVNLVVKVSGALILLSIYQVLFGDLLSFPLLKSDVLLSLTAIAATLVSMGRPETLFHPDYLVAELRGEERNAWAQRSRGRQLALVAVVFVAVLSNVYLVPIPVL